MSESTKSSVPSPVVAIAGWILPGAGYWIIGQRARAVTVAATILILFVLGLLVGGLKVVEVPTGFSFPEIMEHPWYVGQILAGPVTMVSARLAADPEDGRTYPNLERRKIQPSYAHVNEIGTLYTAVAGMLNLLVIIDSSYRAVRGEQGMRGEARA